MNTPGGNTIATCELTFSMMMGLARNIPQAHGSMISGEWNRKSFKGVELYNKTSVSYTHLTLPTIILV